ncbi:MAG: cupin domain-containing protein [Haloferacaceae archaeon]
MTDEPTRTELTTLDALDGAPHAEVFDRRDPRVVRLALDAGERVPAHRHPEANVVAYLVSGRLDLSLDDETHELRAGDAIRFDGRREVSPRAVERSVALLVLAPKANG